jgi:4-diphosphocytidyl-2C-methyl-D-erythritol kinase
LIVRSPAKLNLYLKVLRKRKDGYHNLKTIFERVSLCDIISLRLRRDGKIAVCCDNPRVPLADKNIAFVAAALLQKSFRIRQGVEISIKKRIPVGAGLGGGSSNAASVLLGLNKLWKLGLSKAALARLAKRLGSDVPFFIYEKPFAQGSGRGEKIRLLPALNKVRLWHVLVVPKREVLTSEIYKKWDRNRGTFSLTMPEYDVKIWTSALKNRAVDLLPQLLLNDLEKITLKDYPGAKKIKERLRAEGQRAVLMSGSGPAVFAICASRKEALALSRKLGGAGSSSLVVAVKTF